MQYGNVPNHFHVTMVSDDRSRMVDLGDTSFEQLDLSLLPKLPAHPHPSRDFVPAMVGHVYLVHTADRNTDLYALFRVDQLNPDRSCDISWKRSKAPGIPAPGTAEPKLKAQRRVWPSRRNACGSDCGRNTQPSGMPYSSGFGPSLSTSR
ncbi:MAG: hypothetical protein CMJ64_13425 [Planctomycetaceae bacterium]|nr:hypothetical protein [Planctomycetaceae bacterium]